MFSFFFIFKVGNFQFHNSHHQFQNFSSPVSTLFITIFTLLIVTLNTSHHQFQNFSSPASYFSSPASHFSSPGFTLLITNYSNHHLMELDNRQTFCHALEFRRWNISLSRWTFGTDLPRYAAFLCFKVCHLRRLKVTFLNGRKCCQLMYDTEKVLLRSREA